MSHLSDIYVELYKRKQWDKIPIVKLGAHSYGYLTDKQLHALELLTDPTTTHIGYGGSARSGKSILEAYWQTLQCLAYPGVRYGLGREELKRLMTKTINTYYALWNLWGFTEEDYKFEAKYSVFVFANGSEIPLIETAYQPRDRDFLRYGGLELTACAVDESNESKRKAIDTLFSRTGWAKNEEYQIPRKMFETFNPDKSHVYSRYYLPYRDGKETDKKKFVPALPSDNPHPAVAQWIEDVVSTGDKVLVERLVMGNFDYEDDPSILCDWDAISDIFTNDHVLPTTENYISADLAMQGRDRFVAGSWQGLVCTVDIDKAKATGKEIEQDLKLLKVEREVPNSHIVADSDGLGAYLDSYIDHIKTFHGGSRAAHSEEFFNMKSECCFKLAELINNRQIKVICSKEQEDLIKEELGSCLKRQRLDNDMMKKAIISKDLMKEKLGRSPDYLDMLMMRMQFEVQVSKAQIIS